MFFLSGGLNSRIFLYFESLQRTKDKDRDNILYFLIELCKLHSKNTCFCKSSSREDTDQPVSLLIMKRATKLSFMESLGSIETIKGQWSSDGQAIGAHILLTLLHSEWPKLHWVLAILSAMELKRFFGNAAHMIRVHFVADSMRHAWLNRQGVLLQS